MRVVNKRGGMRVIRAHDYVAMLSGVHIETVSTDHSSHLVHLIHAHSLYYTHCVTEYQLYRMVSNEIANS